MRKTFVSLGVAFVVLAMLVMTASTKITKVPPGRAITGGSFWAGNTGDPDAMAATWVATHPIHYDNEVVSGNAYNTYGPNIREFSIPGTGVSKIILEGQVTLKDFGVWPWTSYFEIGIGGSLNSWFQYFGSTDGTVYIIFFGNEDGGYDIHIQDYVTHRPPESAIYRTTGIPGEDPVHPATFHYVAEFDLVSKLAYLTINGVSVAPVGFGKAYYFAGDEDFNVPLGIFAGLLSVDTDNGGLVNMSSVRVTVVPKS